MTVATALYPEVARRQVRLFGIDIDVLRIDEAVAQLLDWIERRDGECRYVVTPNVDHAVLFQQDAELRQAYAESSLTLADGAPVVAASRLVGRPLPERVAGSDLAPRLFSEAAWRGTGLRVYLLGGAAGVAHRAAERINAAWPGVEVVGLASPPLGFERDEAFNAELAAEINACEPDVLLIGLGAPKQERWIHRHYCELNVPAALCVGATIDFLAGERRRAPVWMRGIGLEWLFRALCEPRRLIGRYARDAWVFPRLVWDEWRLGRVAGNQ